MNESTGPTYTVIATSITTHAMILKELPRLGKTKQEVVNDKLQE